MITAMENLKEMVDVNKIIGDAVETPDGHVIIPVSKVTFGFVTGGTEFDYDEGKQTRPDQNQQNDLPFGGGSGGGISIQPMAFLVVGAGEVRLLPINRNAIFDRLVDLAPQVIEQLQELFKPENAKVPVKKL
jgi:sporulation protein YtfJ